MKYKVGDKVKLRNDLIVGKNYGNLEFLYRMKEWLNKELTIDSINYENHTFGNKESDWYFSFEMIRECTKDYTWEDFLKCPIGTKVTFESGEILFKNDKDEYGQEFGNMRDNFSYEDLENFKLQDSDYGKIIKIEEPTYTLVYEPTEQVEEMTLEEICKELGREIKIVKEKSND